MYDHRNDSEFTVDDCRDVVGREGTLALTGTIIESGESRRGPFVRFKLDERWGFPVTVFTIDLDALEEVR